MRIHKKGGEQNQLYKNSFCNGVGFFNTGGEAMRLEDIFYIPTRGRNIGWYLFQVLLQKVKCIRDLIYIR